MKRSNKVIFSSFMVLTLMQGAARAQDAAPDWSGFYAGVEAGPGWGNDKDGEAVAATGAPTGFAPGIDMRGISVGPFLGYNYRLNSTLIGIEGDLDEDNNVMGKYTGGSQEYSSKVRWLTSLRLRLGLPVENYLPYVTGGAVWSERENVYTVNNIQQSLSNNRPGWTVGAGVEYAPSWAPDWSGRVEYRYTGFGAYTDTPTDVLPGLSYHHELDMNTVMFGVSYHLPFWK